MATRTVAQKLQIRVGHRVAAINAPSDYRTLVGDLPEGATVGPFSPSIDVVHLFVRDRAELADQAPRVLADVGSDTVLWISYPKRSGARRQTSAATLAGRSCAVRASILSRKLRSMTPGRRSASDETPH